MKTLDELGISPAPWVLSEDYVVMSSPDKIGFVNVVHNDPNEDRAYITTDIPDARLIKSSPTMYKTLFDEYNFLNAIYEEMPNEQIRRRMFVIADVLAAASGESEARVWCKHDPTRKCVDCEGCPDESEVRDV